jgi:hypothetical protein
VRELHAALLAVVLTVLIKLVIISVLIVSVRKKRMGDKY